MNEDRKISNYYKDDELNIEKVIDEYSGYVYKIIENMVIKHLSKEDIEEIISDTYFLITTEQLKNLNDIQHNFDKEIYKEIA